MTPMKKGTSNCVYCQLGETKGYASTPENLQDSVPCPERILSYPGNVMSRKDLMTVDIVTFSVKG